MLTLTSPVETWLHGVRAGVKLGVLIAVSVIVFRISNAWYLGIALGLTAALYATAGRGLLGYGLRLLWPLWPFVALIVLWHLWRGTPATGQVVILRMVIAVMVANLVTMTTRLDSMVVIITRVAAPLQWVGLPPRRFAIALALVIRFIPDVLAAADRLAQAWRARSSRRAGHRLIAPLTLYAIDTADHVAEALRARGGVG
jgi:biotin transport system permease protein